MPYRWTGGELTMGVVASVSKVADNIDAAFTYESGGDASFLHFVAQESQSAGSLTLYVFCDSETGNPSDVRVALYNGDGAGATDLHRPEFGGSAVVTSGAIDFNGTGGTWVAMAMTGVTLVEGTDYFLIIDNRTGTPSSNYPTIVRKGGGSFFTSVAAKAWGGGFTADGFTTDPTLASGPSSMGLKYASGNTYGHPYISGANLTSVTHTFWGIRWTPTEDLVLRGMWSYYVHTAITGTGIWKSDGTLVQQNTIDTDWKFGVSPAIDLFAPVTLTGGVEYDCLWTRTSSTTIVGPLYMGEASPPADVSGVAWGTLVHGTAVGASLTEDATRFPPQGFIFDDNPAIAGGGGGLLTHPGMTGGMRG